MSGPPDRSRSGAPDPDWPAEDLERRRAEYRDQNPWSADDPWSSTVPGWDEWPPVTPPDEGFTYGEPVFPSSDPWAESWTDEPTTDRPSPPIERPEPSAEPPPAEPPGEWPPQPAAEAAADELLRAEAPPEERITSPWEPPAHVEPERVPEAEPSPEREPEPEIAPEPERGMEPERDAGPPGAPVEPEPQREEGWSSPWRPDSDDWIYEPVDIVPVPLEPAEAEPEPFVRPETEPEPALFTPTAAEEPEPFAAEAEAEPEPEPEPFAAEAEPEPEPEPFAAEAEPEPEPEPLVPYEVPPSEPIHATWEADAAPAAPDVVEPEAAPEPYFVGEEAPYVAEPYAAEPYAPEPYAPQAEEAEEPFAAEEYPAEPYPAEPYPTPGSAAEEDAAEAEPEPVVWGEREPIEPALAPLPPLPFDMPAGEPTQVFPSDWAPPPVDRDAPLEPAAGEVRTSLAPGVEIDEEVAIRPTVAEQAVPWLIGVILLLAGMVIVLMALIFAGDASLGGIGADPSGEVPGAIGSGSPGAAGAATSAEPTRTPAPSATASPTPVPGPVYGALEVVYQGRNTALQPIYLLRRDFSVEGGPIVLAQDPTLDVRRFAWGPEGTHGVALLGQLLVAVDGEGASRQLSQDITTGTFGDDGDTLYAVRIVTSGTQDTATVVAIDYAEGTETEIASVSYTQPQIVPEATALEAQFADEGGPVRIYWMDDETLRLWVLGGGAWTIDPESGELTEASTDLPALWGPEGEQRIVATTSGASTTLAVVDDEGDTLEEVTVPVLVSHLRWSPDGRQVIFTGGRAVGGGVLQDLFWWTPLEGSDPGQITNTGAAFGVEWLGSQPLWRDAE